MRSRSSSSRGSSEASYKTSDHRIVSVPWSDLDPEAVAGGRPWRTFPWYLGQRNYSGLYWCATERAVLQFSAADGGPATPETLAHAGEMLDYLHVQLDARRGRGGGDPLSLLVNDPGDDALTEQEVIGLCFLFLIAGPDTVTSATGFALYEMARAPELQLRLRSDESAIPAFIEELLRVASPVPFVPRKRTGEITFAGVTIPAGSECWLGLGAANRDTARFTEPSTIHLVQQTHFAFGRGPHRCLGSHLARLELQLIVEEWNRRIPEYALVSEPEIHWPNALLHFEEVRLRLGT